MKYGDLTRGHDEVILNRLVAAAGGDEGVLMKIVQGVVKVVIKAVSYLTTTHKVTVNYDRSIVDSVQAGKYDWSNSDITDGNFPSEEKGTREIEFGLFHFKRVISSEDAEAGLKAEGFRPATMKELLAYGEKHPEDQRRFPIVALGSVVLLGGDRRVGCLSGGGSGRGVGLGCGGGGWSGGCRFLAVRI